MSVCIQYSRPSSGSTDGEIFGLDVAVTNFLSAYFRNSTQKKYYCRPSDMPSFDHFKLLAKEAGHDVENKCVGLDPRSPRHNLESIKCIFRPDPLLSDLIWQRQQVVGTGYAACGLIHTMSGERIAREVTNLCLTPCDDSDALICPSEAIREAVLNLWSLHNEYLNHRFGGDYACPIQTPVIPLGVDCNKYQNLSKPDLRKKQRDALNIKDDEIVILFLGRLSFASKSHPLAMWQALEKAAAQTSKSLRIVMFGYFKPKDMEKHFRALAKDILKTVSFDFIMNDDTRFPHGFWAGADIFISLADNIQESFGLTPVEALAAGLPAVITNWNGYRDSVRDGVDGFLIPTLIPPESSGLAIAEAYFNERNYGISLMGAAQSTAVDIGLCADRISKLANDETLRRKMAAAGKKQAETTYDWSVIIKQYEELWVELSDRRKKNSRNVSTLPKGWQAVEPSFPNPYYMFGGFASDELTMDVAIKVAMPPSGIELILRHEMNYFIPELLIPKDQMVELIEAIRRAGSPSVIEILAPFPKHGHDRLLRCLGWMLKHGVCVSEKRT